MRPLALLALIAGVAYVVTKAAPKSTPAPAAAASLDPGMDAATALLVQEMLQTGTDAAAMKTLASSLASKGFKNSAAALSLKATTLCTLAVAEGSA